MYLRPFGLYCNACLGEGHYKEVNHIWLYNLSLIMMCVCGPGSSVGIATGYGLDGPGSNPGGGEIFHTCLDQP